MIVRTRMAPSPTGEYHVGHLATLLKNFAFAKKHGGSFVLRIEDTDQERKVEGAVEKIMQVIRDYGLDWDEGPDKGGPFAPYTQSERLPTYRKYAEELVEKSQAYYCFCSKERLDEVREKQIAAKQPPMYDRHCRTLSSTEVQKKLANNEPYVIRLKIPDNKDVVFSDLIRGDISIHSSIIDDQVLLKSDGFPTYHLAVVVDDHLMEITHIMRGEEWISSTPKHILLYEAFGWEKPVYAHIPVFLNPDGKGKMSKRKGTVAAQSFIDQGYLPEAMLNFFMILGWTPKNQREILTVEEYIQEFDPKDISPKSVAFDLKKLDWMNGVYIRNLTQTELKSRLKPFVPADFPMESFDRILHLVFERLVKLSDFDTLTDFFYRPVTVDEELLTKKASPELIKNQLQTTYDAFQSVDSWQTEEIEQILRSIQEKNDWKKSQYFMMIRVALTGRQATPPLFETIEVLGKKRTLERLQELI